MKYQLQKIAKQLAAVPLDLHLELEQRFGVPVSNVLICSEHQSPIADSYTVKENVARIPRIAGTQIVLLLNWIPSWSRVSGTTKHTEREIECTLMENTTARNVFVAGTSVALLGPDAS